jgi:hypothetical protein
VIAKLIWDINVFVGKLQKEIYMNVPEGISTESNNCLKLSKIIHGLVLSA